MQKMCYKSNRNECAPDSDCWAQIFQLNSPYGVDAKMCVPRWWKFSAQQLIKSTEIPDGVSYTYIYSLASNGEARCVLHGLRLYPHTVHTTKGLTTPTAHFFACRNEDRTNGRFFLASRFRLSKKNKLSAVDVSISTTRHCTSTHVSRGTRWTHAPNVRQSTCRSTNPHPLDTKYWNFPVSSQQYTILGWIEGEGGGGSQTAIETHESWIYNRSEHGHRHRRESYRDLADR